MKIVHDSLTQVRGQTIAIFQKYSILVYTKTVDSVDGARWLARQTPDIYLRATREKMASGLHPWQVKKSSKLIVYGVYYLTVLVYTKTTIHLSVGG